MRACILKQDALLTVMEKFYRNSHHATYEAGSLFVLETNASDYVILRDEKGLNIYVPAANFSSLFDCLEQTPALKGKWSIE